jgi:hypothetical protein
MTRERRTERNIALVIFLNTFALSLRILGDGYRYVTGICISAPDRTFFEFKDLFENSRHPYPGFFTPLTTRYGAANPPGHYLTSLLIHGVNTGLVIFLVIHLLSRQGLKRGTAIQSFFPRPFL